MSGILNEKENEAAGRFVFDHYERRCGGKKNAKLELTATATGLGFSITIRCPNCDATENITDTDSW